MTIGENLKRVYQCRLCKDVFSSGPKLGGHMRCHMAKNPLEREPPLVMDRSSSGERRLGYGLRENPKKSWKFLGLTEDAQENPCQVCDKRFRSTRALFRHMKIHTRNDGESADRCQDRGKGSGSKKSCRDHARPIRNGERLNLSLLNKDRSVGSSKTKSDLLLIVLSDDERMGVTRRKRTPRIPCDVDQRTEGVLFSVSNGSSCSSEAEEDPDAEEDLDRRIVVSLMMMYRGETDYNTSGLGVQPFVKSSSPHTEASKYNESHSRGHSRMEKKGVELEARAGMLCGAREVGHKKPKRARSSEEPLHEAVMMDHDGIRTTGSDSRELWTERGPNLYGDKFCAEESQVFIESSEENKYKSKDAENYKQEAPIIVSQELEWSRGCTELESTSDDLEKVNRDAPEIGI